MLKLTKKTDYSIIILTHLGGANAPVSAKRIAEKYNLPYPMVANILKLLVSSGLVKSVRGQLGGYMLSVPAQEILLSEIIQVTDNPFALVECVHKKNLCKVRRCCPTHIPLIALHNKIQKFIDETTLDLIIKDAQMNNLNLENTKYEITHLS